MPANISVIEKKAFGIAAANYLHFENDAFNQDPYSAYIEYEAALDENRQPEGLEVWAPFSSLEDGVLEQINDLASHIADGIKSTLALSKAGVVSETIEGRIDSDMNALDMQGLAEIGHALEAGICADAGHSTPNSNGEDVVLRRYSIGVTRVAVSSEQQFSVLATSQRDAEGLVHDEASDRVFVIKVDDEVKEMALVTMLSPKK
jgi:hypothetical protein